MDKLEPMRVETGHSDHCAALAALLGLGAGPCRVPWPVSRLAAVALRLR